MQGTAREVVGGRARFRILTLRFNIILALFSTKNFFAGNNAKMSDFVTD